MNLNFFFDNKRGGENSLTKCLLFKWHFELILLLMNLQALSFSYSTLTLFNLYVLSVLLVASFSLLKKLGSSFRAHRCRSLSFPRVCWTVLIFIGVTHVPISSSPTGVAVAACRTIESAEGCVDFLLNYVARKFSEKSFNKEKLTQWCYFYLFEYQMSWFDCTAKHDLFPLVCFHKWTLLTFSVQFFFNFDVVFLYYSCGRCGDLMVSVLVPGGSGPGSSPGQGHYVPLSTQEYKWVPANCWGNLTNCGGMTCDALASRPGGVEILLAASCCRNHG